MNGNLKGIVKARLRIGHKLLILGGGVMPTQKLIK